MKAEDLMIGDWVYTKVQVDDTGTEPVFEMVPRKVTELSEIINGIYTEKTSTFAGAEIEPIPITIEILEENGFRYEKGYSSSVYRLDEYFLVQYENERYRAYWLSEDGDEDLDKIITYVHELQHILKFCGIYKQIML